MSDLTRVRHVLFDWGGTLCAVEGESEAWRQCMDAILDAARRHGMGVAAAHRESLVETFLRAREAAKSDPQHRELRLVPLLREWAATEHLGGLGSDAVEAMNQACWRAWIGCLRVLDGVPEALIALRKRGYRVGLVSNVVAPPEWCRVQLETLGLWDVLDSATFSSGVGVRKPHPRIFEAALAAHGDGELIDPGQVLFAGDSPVNDVLGAIRAGMHTALVRDLAGIWPAADFEQASPDLSVESVRDLLPHLTGAA